MISSVGFFRTRGLPMNLKKILVSLLASIYAIATAQVDVLSEKSPPQIARDAFPSVVLITMEDQRGQPLKLGSGFFVEANTVATNFHVIEGAAAGYAKIVGQPKKLTIAGIVATDPLHDLALLQVDSSPTTYLLVMPVLSVNVGDTVYAIGNPLGLEGSFSQGMVSSVRVLGSDRLLQITAAISPGSSGGR